MTTQTVHLQTFDYGSSLTSATLRALTTDNLVATADSTNEVTADGGLYAIVFGETAVIPAGTYRLRAIVSSQPIQRYVTLAGTDGEIVQASLVPPDANIAAIKAKTDTMPDQSRVIISDGTNGREVKVTAAKHIAADVHALQQEALAQFATDNTGETSAAAGSVALLSQGSATGTGTGARTVTITVNDGTTALQNAKVRLTEGANTFVGTTNASGVVTFNVDDATYTVAITKSGYSYAGTTVVVDGDELRTYSMTAVTITPGGDTGEVTGYFTVRDEVNNAESGVTIYCRMLGIDDSSTGDAHDGANRTEVSAGNGLVQFEGLLIGGTYEFWRVSDSAARKVTIPDTAETQAGTYALPDIIGGA